MPIGSFGLIAKKIMESDENISPYFFSVFTNLKFFLQCTDVFPLGLKTIDAYLLKMNYMPPRELLDDFFPHYDVTNILGFYANVSHFYNNEGLGIKLYTKVLTALSIVSEHEAIQFFVYSLEHLSSADMRGGYHVVHNYFNQGLSLLKKHHLLHTICHVFERLNKIDLLNQLTNYRQSIIIDAFSSFLHCNDYELVLCFLKATSNARIHMLDYIDVVLDHFNTIGNIRGFCAACSLLMSTSSAHPIEKTASLVGKKINKILLSNKTSIQEGKTILKLCRALQQHSTYDLSTAILNQILCCSILNIDKQLRRLVELNLSLMTDEYWKLLLCHPLQSTNSCPSKRLELLSNFIEKDQLSRFFETACLVSDVSFSRETEIWEAFEAYIKPDIKS